MKRVGIITIQSIVNYGNRLQNYAVEQLLRNKNVEVESIRIAEPILWTKIYIKAYTSAFIGGLKNDKECQNRGIRTKKFLAFNEKHLNIKIVRSKKAKKNFKRYDFVFLGGDQLWAQGNKDYGIEGYRFGSLTTPEKRIPFGVSFGTEKILNEYGEVIAPWLKQLQHLAIREKQEQILLKNLQVRQQRFY